MRQSEQFNQKTQELDSLEIKDILLLINDEDNTIAPKVRKAIPQITKVIEQAVSTIEHGGRVIYLGSGASGDIAQSDAQEMQATYGVPFETFRSIHLQLGPNLDWTKLENQKLKKRQQSEDGDTQLIEDLKSIKFTKKDFIIGISVSGSTSVIVKTLEWAKSQGAPTACVVMNEDSPMAKASDLEIVVVTGAEVVSGSTRMKGGTCTKLILNMISTGTMVKCGNTYKGLMVALSVPPEGNSKLVQRAATIISKLTNLDEEEAKKLFFASGQNIKVAVVSNLQKISIDEARKKVEKLKNLAKILD